MNVENASQRETDCVRQSFVDVFHGLLLPVQQFKGRWYFFCKTFVAFLWESRVLAMMGSNKSQMSLLHGVILIVS